MKERKRTDGRVDARSDVLRVDVGRQLVFANEVHLCVVVSITHVLVTALDQQAVVERLHFQLLRTELVRVDLDRKTVAIVRDVRAHVQSVFCNE